MRETCLFFSTTCFLLFFCQFSFAQETSSEADYPADFRKYEFLEYSGGSSVISPRDAISADNNWEILLACLEAKTVTELEEMGVDLTRSQLLLLRAMRFIDYDMKTRKFKTSLPILGSEKKRLLIKRMRSLAVKLEPLLRTDVNSLLGELKKNGRKENAFTILFSYALDAVPWKLFQSKGVIGNIGLSPERPLYDGVYWAYYPPRGFRCGTNFFRGEGFYIALNWGEPARKKIFSVFHNTNMRQMRDDFQANGKIVSPGLIQELITYGLFDSEGNLTIPVIEEGGDGGLFEVCHRLGEKAASLFIEEQDLEALKNDFGFYNLEYTVIVCYHEWMWEYLEYLDEIGLVSKPFAFSNPEKAGPEHIGRLLFMRKYFEEAQ